MNIKKVFGCIALFASLNGAYAQKYSHLFNRNSEYIVKGSFTVETADTTASGLSYTHFKKIPYRTVAVNPRQILPGSVLFIPRYLGMKLSDGTFHDGYFLAHDTLNSPNDSVLKIYISKPKSSRKTNAVTRPEKEPAHVDVFVVRGIMDKVTRMHYSLEYAYPPAKRICDMTATDLNDLMNLGNKMNEISQRIQFYSEKCKGTPYLIGNLGEGVNQPPDPDPVIDFSRMDCMTLCEHVLALSISNEYNQMYGNLQKIRYKNGQISFMNRNHYAISDWLPNNRWLLEDITKEIGDTCVREISKMIDRQNFYLSNGVSPELIKDSIPVENSKAFYIPNESLLKIKDRLKGGEIVSIVTSIPGIISAHMGIIVRDEWGNVIFRHASSSVNVREVVDQSFDEVVNSLLKSPTRIGMIFMRARDNYMVPR